MRSSMRAGSGEVAMQWEHVSVSLATFYRVLSIVACVRVASQAPDSYTFRQVVLLAFACGHLLPVSRSVMLAGTSRNRPY